MAEEHKSFHLSVLTPEGSVLESEVVYVALPAANGSMGVMYHHAPLVAALDTGIMKVRYPDQRTVYYALGEGFLEVKANHVSVLSDFLNEAGEVDIERARKALARAKERMAARAGDLDQVRAEASLRRAMVRLRVASLT